MFGDSTPSADVPDRVIVIGDLDSSLMTEFQICLRCAFLKTLNLQEVLEAENRKRNTQHCVVHAKESE